MKILALDLGTKCGYAFSDGQSGVWNFKPSTHETAGERYRKFWGAIESAIKLTGVTFIVYEEVHAHIGVEASHVYGAFVGILQALCLNNKIEYKGVPVQTIKKHATGNGNAKKDDMIVAATLKFSKVNVIDDNHADALHLLDYAISCLHLQNEP